MLSFDHRVDNPDQRITQDVDYFSTTFSSVLSSCISAPLIIGWYTYQTVTIIAWFIPLLISGYFFLGYFINKLIMSPIVKMVFRQEQLEGDFRYAHARVRTWAESIALYGGGERERLDTEKTFAELLKNKMRIMKWQYSLNSNFLRNFYEISLNFHSFQQHVCLFGKCTQLLLGWNDSALSRNGSRVTS